MAQDRNEVGSGPDENEPKTIEIPGRSLAGATYGATEREQTADVRSRTVPREEGTTGDRSGRINGDDDDASR